MHLARAVAGPEIFIQHNAALGLDDLVAHPLPPRDVLSDARVGWRANDRPSLLHEVPDLLGRLLAEDPAGVAERVDPRQGAVEAHRVLEVGEAKGVEAPRVLRGVTGGFAFVDGTGASCAHG